MKSFTKIGLVAMLSLVFTGCLDKYPDNAIPDKEAIQSVSDANQAVIGIYASYKSSALYSGYLTLLPDIQADLVYSTRLRVSVCGTGTLKIKFSGFSWEYAYTHYYLIPKNLVYYQVRLLSWICLG